VNNPGKFIVFEGIDGSGKSTQCKLLHRKMNQFFGSCHLTCEPSERPVGKMIREIFSGKLPMDNLVVAGLFVADRLDHLVNKEDGIINLLGQNTHVISDRYYLSSMAYQSVFAPMEWILKANDQARQMLKADITFYLDLDPEKGMERINHSRDSKEIYEEMENLRSVHHNYQKALEWQKKEENIIVISADQPSEIIETLIWSEVQKLFLQDPGSQLSVDFFNKV